ncbi:hypothetical protein HPB50_027065 [Hyalomma asiaticum]|uniref:Uncharacterized protein n=1 Tax=Hyalomma asiaticum TaxID=266040 RepID=A0ACB7RU68_HYAAI|nr:hypothetical protein HPB50_027065 [Hyalomma asiaticum]
MRRSNVWHVDTRLFAHSEAAGAAATSGHRQSPLLSGLERLMSGGVAIRLKRTSANRTARFLDTHFSVLFVLCRHKKKVQNFLPCKSPHQGVPCDLSAANGAAYSDILLNHHHPTRLPAHLVHGTDTHTLTPIELTIDAL